MSEKEKSDWSNSHPKEKISAELHNSPLSIHKMSLQEIQSIWAAQYKYHNFATNYKRLQKKIKSKLSQRSKDCKYQSHTSLNPLPAKKPPIKYDESKKPLHGSIVPKKHLNKIQNIALLLVFVMSFT